jgi:hypothetical protein
MRPEGGRQEKLLTDDASTKRGARKTRGPQNYCSRRGSSTSPKPVTTPPRTGPRDAPTASPPLARRYLRSAREGYPGPGPAAETNYAPKCNATESEPPPSPSGDHGASRQLSSPSANSSSSAKKISSAYEPRTVPSMTACPIAPCRTIRQPHPAATIVGDMSIR